MPHLFEPFRIKSVELRNRIAVSPMCMYSAEGGAPNDWHLVHLGARAAGGAGLVVAEATGVEARGRITPRCTGIWSDAHIEPWARITRFIAEQGAVPGIQLAHAGRKASAAHPWSAERGHLANEAGGWDIVAPSAEPFGGVLGKVPTAMTHEDIRTVQRAFAAGARRAREAGFRWIELHYAHGYLGHEFFSPISNKRTDEYGGSLENRMRFGLETIRAVKQAWPADLPLTVRISACDWLPGGITLEESIEFARRMKAEGVDLVDCSSGHIAPEAYGNPGPGWQVPLAEAIRRDAAIATGAVGKITEPAQADAIIREGRADIVFLATKMLDDPHWPMHAAWALGHSTDGVIARQYSWALRK